MALTPGDKELLEAVTQWTRGIKEEVSFLSSLLKKLEDKSKGLEPQEPDNTL